MAHDDNDAPDVFVRDLLAGTTALVSVNLAGTSSRLGASGGDGLSADGRYVVFTSSATDLVAPEAGPCAISPDVFVRDLLLGVTRRVAVPGAGFGPAGLGMAIYPLISPDGRVVVFASDSACLWQGFGI